jgi:hypothetical protein
MHLIAVVTVASSVTLLEGVVGSGSMLGIYAEPAISFHGLYPPKHSTNPDVTMQEALKFCRLALDMNPTVYELLWLEGYMVKTSLGEELIRIRKSFQSRTAVRNAYLGYATQQFKRLQRTGDLPRGEKNARHLLRLLIQGADLYSTGELTVRLSDPEYVRRFGKEAIADPDVAVRMIRNAELMFNASDSPLPESPRHPSRSQLAPGS